MCPVLWRFWSCSPEQYCAFLAPHLRYRFDVFPQVPPAFLVKDPCSRAIGEQSGQMPLGGQSLWCGSHADDSLQMPMRLQTMSGWTKRHTQAYASMVCPNPAKAAEQPVFFALTACGKSRRRRKRHTSGAKARTQFQRVRGTTEVVSFPKPVRIGVFSQAAKRT